MSSGLIGIAISGLRAAQTGLATTGHNIANVNTAGYSRQQSIQTPAAPTFTGAGYIGQGVAVQTVRRVYSDYATQSLRDASASSAHATAYSNEIKRIDGWLADASSNLSAAIDGFFSTVQTVANDPSDVAARQTMLSSARTLAARFNDLDQRLSQQGADVDRQIDDNVVSVNSLAQQVATLNQRILTDGRDPSIDQIPNDLLDQRDALVKQLASTVGANAIPQSDGSLAVFVGNGQPLVVGSHANTLITVPDDQDTSKKQLAVMLSGTPTRVPTQQVSGGTIGGMIAFRDDVLVQSKNTLGQIAIGLGAALNAQNRLGQDANGLAGLDLFRIGAPVVTSASGNSSGAGLSVTTRDAAQLGTSDYSLAFDGTSYTLTDLATKTTRTYASLPQTVDGMRIAASGSMAAGDRFTIAPTRAGARDFAVATTDPTRIAAAAPVALTTGSTNTGSAALASLSVVPANPLPSNLAAQVDVRFHVSGATMTFDLVDRASGTMLSAGNAYSDGMTIQQNGWQLKLIGVPANNDAFTIGPNVGGTGDNRNALLLAGVQQKSVTATGSAGNTYAGLVGIVGNRTNEAAALATAEDSLLTQAQESRDAVSGVNLDEEAANLQKYQQAYQAASKSIAAASAMFQTILDLFH